MILAAGGLNVEVILYIAAAIWGVISWVRQKNAPPEQDDDGDFRPTPTRPTPRPIQQTESEEDRMRRFLEALGVPAEQSTPRPQPQPKPPQPQAPPPRPVFQPRPAPQPRPVVPQPRPIARPQPQPVAPEQEEFALAGRLEDPAASIEHVSTEFDRMASGVALPALAELQRRQEVVAIDAVTAMDAVTGTAHERPKAVAAKSVMEMLRSPDSIRTAFVLSEVLGPPKSTTT